MVITWIFGIRPFAIPHASWVAVAPRSGHAGWFVRHHEWSDILYMCVFAAVRAENLARAMQ